MKIKNNLKIFNDSLTDDMSCHEIAVYCYNCDEIFYYYTPDKTLKPVICPFCKSKRRGRITWLKNHN